MTIEQLLDFNQGNLYPKITNIKESYVNSGNETETGLTPFINDIFAGFDSSIFELKDNKIISFKETVPGKIETAKIAEKTASALTVKTGKNTTQSFDGSQAVTIDKVYTADKTTGKLTLKFIGVADDENEYPQFIEWTGEKNEELNLQSGVYYSVFAKYLKDSLDNKIHGTDNISPILTVENTGNITMISEPVGGSASKFLLSVSKNDSGKYEYNWVNGSEVGGAQIKQSAADAAYYILGATEADAEVIHGNFNGRSPYFKNANLYQTSDATLKTFSEDLDVDLDNLASIKKGLFYWNDDEEKVLDLGVSAQSVEPLFPQVVSETDGIKAVSYSKLSVIALAAIDKLYVRIKELEDEVKRLKAEK